MGKIGHTIVGVLSTVAVVFCACALTDGRSIVTLNTDTKSLPLTLNGNQATLDTDKLPGIGYPYGIGAYSDSNGRKWDDGPEFSNIDSNSNDLDRKASHIVQLFGCDEHQKRGQLVLACVFICLITSSVAVIASLRGVATESRVSGIVSLVFQILGFIFFLIGMAGGASLYNEEFECKSGNVTQFDLKLADYFDLSYALPFLVIGVVASIINIIVLIASGSLSDPEETSKNKGAPDADSSSSSS